MKKLRLQALGLSNTELLTREQLKNVLGGDGGYGGSKCKSDSDCGGGYCMITGCTNGSGNVGGPGGNNGNPCPQYCEPMGGHLMCIGVVNGVGVTQTGNCNTYPYDPNLHNYCMNEATGNFWC